jgi:hypothetical protein
MSCPMCFILLDPSVNEPIIETADNVTFRGKTLMSGRWILSPFWVRTMDVKEGVMSGAMSEATLYFYGSCLVLTAT